MKLTLLVFVLSTVFEVNDEESSIMHGNDEDEEEENQTVVYDVEILQTWTEMEDDVFVDSFDEAKVNALTEHQLRQVLYVARDKHLFKSLDPDVLRLANQKAWESKYKKHYKKPDKVINQIKKRLVKDYESTE
jgi:hypothetical protein